MGTWASRVKLGLGLPKSPIFSDEGADPEASKLVPGLGSVFGVLGLGFSV